MAVRQTTLQAPEGIIITKFRREPGEDFYRARVSLNGVTVDVDSRYGAWMGDARTEVRGRRERKFVAPGVAAELSRRLRRHERRDSEREAAAA
ncbi:MAG: hypothetical protein LC798_12960 [Chloroflexi bacterium]|nr:hypothetical protein [Chloroflexota bacterium]